MQDKDIFLTVVEASVLTNKTEKTIRNCIKKLLEVKSKTSGSGTGSLEIETKGDKNRRFYKISKKYLIKRFNLVLGDQKIDIPITRSEETRDEDTKNILQEWLKDKNQTISVLESQILTKDSQIRDKDEQLIVMSRLIENQQKLTLQLQTQISFLNGPESGLSTPKSNVQDINYGRPRNNRKSLNIERKWWQIWK